MGVLFEMLKQFILLPVNYGFLRNSHWNNAHIYQKLFYTGFPFLGIIIQKSQIWANYRGYQIMYQ